MGAIPRSQLTPANAKAVPRTAVTNMGMRMGNDNTANSAPRELERAIIAATSVVPATKANAPDNNMPINKSVAPTRIFNSTIAKIVTNTVKPSNNNKLKIKM